MNNSLLSIWLTTASHTVKTTLLNSYNVASSPKIFFLAACTFDD